MDIKGKSVFVTGADGFIGSHLVELLCRSGANVKALCYYNSFGSWGWLDSSPCAKDIQVVMGDVRDSNLVRSAVKGSEMVFHLAALIGIPYSYVAPDSYVQTNITGTLNILNACLEHGVGRLVHTSTSEVYGTALRVPIDEGHPLQPQSPYSASKIAADAMATSFHMSFGLPVTIARPFNTYGPRQSARAVIPTIIAQMLKGSKGIKLGDTRPTRDFNYVEDTCRGLLTLALSDKTLGETVNLGSNHEISIGDLFLTIRDIIGADTQIEHDSERVRPKDSEVFRLWADNTKARQLAGYSPSHTLRQGLGKTVQWFSDPANLSHYKEGIYNV